MFFYTVTWFWLHTFPFQCHSQLFLTSAKSKISFQLRPDISSSTQKKVLGRGKEGHFGWGEKREEGTVKRVKCEFSPRSNTVLAAAAMSRHNSLELVWFFTLCCVLGAREEAGMAAVAAQPMPGTSWYPGCIPVSLPKWAHGARPGWQRCHQHGCHGKP